MKKYWTDYNPPTIGYLDYKIPKIKNLIKPKIDDKGFLLNPIYNSNIQTPNKSTSYWIRGEMIYEYFVRCSNVDFLKEWKKITELLVFFNLKSEEDIGKINDFEIISNSKDILNIYSKYF